MHHARQVGRESKVHERYMVHAPTPGGERGRPGDCRGAARRRRRRGMPRGGDRLPSQGRHVAVALSRGAVSRGRGPDVAEPGCELGRANDQERVGHARRRENRARGYFEDDFEVP